jgi:hypothetical protein
MRSSIPTRDPLQMNLKLNFKVLSRRGWIVFAIIFLACLPIIEATDPFNLGHFFSSMKMFEYATLHGFQYGADLIDNVGPLGFLHYPAAYIGGFFYAKTIWYLALCFSFALLTAAFAQHLRSFSLLLFVGGISLFATDSDFPWFSYEYLPRVIIFYAAAFVIKANEKEGPFRDDSALVGFLHALIPVIYGLLLLEKASNVPLILLLIGLIAAWLVFQRAFSRLGFFLALFLGTVSLGWILCHQKPETFASYVLALRYFVDAYEGIVATVMPREAINKLVLLIVVCLVVIATRVRLILKQDRKNPGDLLIVMIAALLTFLAWKHGSLRGGGSIGTFVGCIVPVYFFLIFWPGHEPDAHPRHQALSPLLAAILLIVIQGNLVEMQRGMLSRSIGFVSELEKRVTFVLEYSPSRVQHRLEAEFQALKESHQLPDSIRRTIANGSVDEFGDTPGIVILNDLNYRPRPVPIQYIAGNEALKHANGAVYFSKESAPNFVFSRKKGILAADSKAYLALLVNYIPRWKFDQWTIFEKRAEGWQECRFSAPQPKDIQMGNWVDLPEDGSTWLTANAHANGLRYYATKMFYHIDHLLLIVEYPDHTTDQIPVSLGELKSGFLISPAFALDESVENIGYQPKRVLRFKLEPENASQAKLYQGNSIAISVGSVLGCDIWQSANTRR